MFTDRPIVIDQYEIPEGFIFVDEAKTPGEFLLAVDARRTKGEKGTFFYKPEAGGLTRLQNGRESDILKLESLTVATAFFNSASLHIDAGHRILRPDTILGGTTYNMTHTQKGRGTTFIPFSPDHPKEKTAFFKAIKPVFDYYSQSDLLRAFEQYLQTSFSLAEGYSALIKPWELGEEADIHGLPVKYNASDARETNIIRLHPIAKRAFTMPPELETHPPHFLQKITSFGSDIFSSLRL